MSECARSSDHPLTLGSFFRAIQEIQQDVIRHTDRKWWQLLFHAKYDREKVQAWRDDIQKSKSNFMVRKAVQYTQPMVPEGRIRRL